MLVLSLPKKEKPQDAGSKHLRFAIVAIIMAFFFLCGEVHAQVQPAIINPTGGTALDNNLRIEIRDSCILVRRKGVDQYNLDGSLPKEDIGLRTYFILQQRFGSLYEKDPKYVKACEISDVYGNGTLANPWKIVTLSTFQNVSNATYNVTTVYTYVDGTSYYNVDFFISSNEKPLNGPTGGPYYIHIYLSQRSWMNTVDCSTGFSSGESSIVFDEYLNAGMPDPTQMLKSVVGTKKENGSCPTGPEGEGVNVFKTNGGFTSWFAGPTNSRDVKVSPGYMLSNNINAVPQAQGVAVHKAILMDATDLEINHETKRFAVGFDSTEMKALFVQDPNLIAGDTHYPFAAATIELSDANPSGPEGDNTHVITNLTLKVSGAKFNLPQLATVKVTATTSGVNDAVEGADYEVTYTKILIPAGDYTYTPAYFPLNNILIKGDDDLDPNKTLRVELTKDCSPHLVLGAINDVIYTIIDDDANELFIEPAQTTLEEGKTMKVKLRMSGTPLLTDVVVTLAKGTADAESTDHSVIPATITIPAGSLFAEFDFDAIADRILEPATENLDITATATISGINRTHTTSIGIIDTTGLNPANKVITFTSPATTEGNDATITASLPFGVTTEFPIVIGMTEEPPPTTTTDPTDFSFTSPFPSDMTIAANGNSVAYTLPVTADTKLELQETLFFSGASTGFVFNNGQLDVIQEPVNLTVEFDDPAITTVTEPYYPQIIVRLPYATDFAFDVDLEIDPSSTVDASDYYLPDPLNFKVHFTPGSDFVTFNLLEIPQDYLQELQEKLVIKASSPGFTAGSAALLIDDYTTANPTSMEFFLEAENGEYEFTEGETVRMKITSVGDLSSEPITFTIGNANVDPNINAADFELPLTVTLLPFEREVFFDVKAKTDALTETFDEELVITADANVSGNPYTTYPYYIYIKDGINPVIEYTVSDVTEGGNATVTATLQSGVASSDIVITPARISGSATDDDITLPASFTILATTNSQTFTLTAVPDGILERLETLELGGTATGYIITPVNLNVIDAESAVSANKNITVTPVASDVTEGNTVKVWVSLPGTIKTSEDLTIALTAGAGTVVTLQGTEYTLPASVKILAGEHEHSFDLVAAPDNILEPDEQLEIAASSLIFNENKTASALVNIKDGTGNIAANKIITVTGPVSVTEGGSTANYYFSLPVGITTQDPIVVQLVSGLGTDAAPADFQGNVYPATVTINSSTGTLGVVAKADGVIELQEKLILVPSYLDFTFTQNVDLDIIDADLAGATITLSSSAANVAEGGTVRITATLSVTSATPINVVLAKDGLSVAGSGDHGALGTITIAAGSSDGYVDITASSDLLLENTESLILNGTATGLTVTGTTVNITDATGISANKQITLTPAASTVAEGGSIQVRVSLPNTILTSEALTINLTSGTGTVVTLLGTEYTLPSTVTIPAGGNEVFFTLTANTDQLIEPNETLEIKANATVFGEAVTTSSNVAVTDVTANKLITITGATTVTEGSSATITFSLPSGIITVEALDIDLAVAGTSTALPADFTGVFPNKVTIPPNGDHIDLTLPAKTDGVIEALEKLELIPSAVGGFTFNSNVELDVIDNDLVGASIALSASIASVAEGGTVRITATLSVTSSTDIIVTLAKDGTSQADNTDHGALGSITILAGASSGYVDITASSDLLLENTESLILNGIATGFTVISTTINITDLNGQNSNNKIFTITPVAASIAEGGSTVVKISLPSPHKTQDALTINLSRGALSSASLLTSEYSAFVGSVVIPAGGNEVTFNLDALTDDIIEPTEQLQLEATAMVYGTSITAKTTVDITDVTASKLITITGATTVTEGSSATITFSLPLGITTAEALDINLAVAGTSTALPADFTGVFPTKVTIPPNGDHIDLILPAKTDGVIEALEKLELVPSAVGGFTFNSNVELDVVDNDLAGASIALSASAASVAEGGTVRITATLSATSSTDIIVTLAKDGTSQADNTDHGALSSITILAGASSGYVDITASSDLLLENTESLILNGTATGFTIASTTVNITDATGISANKQITLTPAASTVAEGASIQVRVSLPNTILTSEALTINLTSGTGTVVTLLGSEYTLPSTVTIPAGGNEVFFTLAANTDQLIEPNETLEIKATATVFGEAVTTLSNVAVTDVTLSKLITITGAVSVTEGSSATITFSLPSGTTTVEALDIDLAVAGTSTALPADFTGVFPTKVTIPPNGDHIDLTLPAKTDGVIEALEKLELVPSAVGGFTFNSNVELDVVDNDLAGASIALSASAASVAEGGTVRITATLSVISSTDIIVTLAKDGTSQADNTDHGALGSITILAGASSGYVDITASSDLLLENTESLILNGTTTGLTVTGTTVNITDATGISANKQITLTPAASTVAEGASIQVKVSLPTNILTSEALTISLTSGTGTVATLLGTEYTLPSTVTIPAGGNEAFFTLAANTDQLIEPNETLEIKANATVFGEAVTTSSNVAVTDVTANKLITITGATTVTEGSSATITFSLPLGITTAEALDIDLAVAGTSTALPADFTGVFPTKVTIPPNGDHIDLTLPAKTDGVIEVLEKLELVPSAVGGFTFNSNVELDVVDNDLAGASIALSASMASVAEGGTVRITATLSATSSTDIIVTLAKDGASQADNTDHGAFGSITILAGASSGYVDITASSDLLLENTESLILNGTTTGLTVTGTTVNITDATGTSANKQITLTPAASTVAEGGSIQVRVSLPNTILTSEALTINLTSGTGTVVTLLGTEYTLPSTVTIPAGGNEVFFTLVANTDQLIEPNETLEIKANATVFGEAVTTSSNVAVTDVTLNKLITITGATTVTEGNSTTITFSLPLGTTTTEAIEINLAQGTNTPAVIAGDLNGGIPDKVIIPAGGNDITLTIQPNTDGVIETVEKLHLIPSAIGGFTFNQDVLLDVLDQSHSGTITFSSNTTAITEALDVATITVSLPGVLTAGSDIQVNITKGISSAGNADHSVLPAFVTIANGQHETTFTVTAPLDLILEGNEDLVLEGSALGYGVSGTTIQIQDSTHRDPLNTVITLNPNGGSISEGTTGHFHVSLPNNVVSTTPIVVQLAKTAASSTAADTDHTQIPVSITIPANSNVSANFDISAVVDGIIEPTEVVKVDGVVPAGFTFAGTNIDITDVTGLTLANRQIQITIDSTILHEGNTSKVTFALQSGITSSTDIAITVNADGGFSAAAADFTLTPNTVILPKDMNTVTVILEAIADNTDEPDEQLKLTGTATGFTVLPGGTVNIPGSGAPAVTVTAVKTTDAAEPSTQGVFTIKLPGAANAPADITVNYTVTGTAVSNDDYIPLSGVTIIKAGDNSVAVLVNVKDDQIIEGDEALQLTLQSASFVHFGNTIAASVDNSGGAGMLILDNENTAEGRKILIEKIHHAAEPNENGSVRVRFADAQFTATVPVTVTYTVAGTATAGVDYNTLSGTVTIPAGDHEAIISIVPIDDTDQESIETITIQLTGASAGLPLATQQQVSVDLYDNDKMTVEVFASASVTEGTTIPVTVRASKNTPVDMPVTISLQHDAFRTVTTSATFTITIPANQKEATANVVLVDNDVNDDNGFVNLAIQPFAGGGQPYAIGSSATSVTTVTDNDALEISFKVDTARVKEGNSAITPLGFTVKLNRMSSRVVNLNYLFADAFEGAGADKDPMRARAGEDFQPHITSLAIAPMQLEAEIVVPVIGDVDAEIDQLFAIRLTTATVASLQNAAVVVNPLTAIGIIQNDDQPIETEIKVNKGLSPNGDGKNDVLFIENLDKYTQNEIVIVNRWGGTVYKTSNYNNQSNNFSGRANTGGGSGSNLPDGSYFFVLHVWDSNGNMTRHTGYIVLKR
ncbi:T9SS type B sorting domain-containing protein [Chitinophaga sp. SYP-B3965]|uniref:T9SS type B sorting domain-containing protein n=1 Tax=Chitinophaga sp. SYP-B3965 TaxID=2663120 RepID=UPI0012998F3F|nr:Calx-beta domain-containing protein [Chitinophaga sp. SYP-B3965]MRG48621.1 T9SS type B sorting domain-containing protein [Chitinophaga sp. SYP-B3965]